MELTIEKLAQSLDLPVSTVERWVRQGRIPVQKRGTMYKFYRASVEKWAQKHHLPFHLPDKDAPQVAAYKPETLLTAMERGGVYHSIQGASVEHVLKAAVDAVSFLDGNQKEQLYDQLLEREQLTSTGIGRGVAIPHPRTPIPGAIDKPIIITCFLAEPVDYGAVDDKPVFVLFLLISPSVKIHLHLLSRLSYCMRKESFIRFLKEQPRPDVFFKQIADVESRLDAADG